MQVATPVDNPKVVYYNGTQPFPIMSTEDDTFAALKRITFAEMRIKVGQLKRRYVTSAEDMEFDELFRTNGWTQKEYEDELLLTFTGHEGLIIKVANSYKVSHSRVYAKFKS